MLKLITNAASPAEKNFIRVIYGITREKIRIILDEYDLLLYDLKIKNPFVAHIPDGFITTDFVTHASNKDLFPTLSILVASRNRGESKQKDKMDPHSGKGYQTVSFYSYNAPNQHIFHLYVSIMRLAMLLKRADRVIGLSGTGTNEQTHDLQRVRYFEIPSSQNPETFGTKYQENPGAIVDKSTVITCTANRKFSIAAKEDNFILIEEEIIKAYCDAIIADINDVRKEYHKGGISYKRPILIFLNPLLKYRLVGKGPNEKLVWDAVKEAIINQITDANLRELKSDQQDVDIQFIARSGAITLTTIKYGRGADIRVSRDIEEGLHVIVGLQVVHDRLKQQLIGRTGRMGRQGSYSSIIIDEGETFKENDEFVPLYNALHDVTGCFVNRLTTRPYDEAASKKWLLFLSNSKCSGAIKTNDAKNICGEDYFQPNAEFRDNKKIYR